MELFIAAEYWDNTLRAKYRKLARMVGTQMAARCMCNRGYALETAARWLANSKQ